MRKRMRPLARVAGYLVSDIGRAADLLASLIHDKHLNLTYLQQNHAMIS